MGWTIPRLSQKRYICRFDEVLDQEAVLSLPILSITDFDSGLAGKAEIVLIAGEHAKELITSEIVLWLAYLLTGINDEELLEWTALQPIQATAWKSGWTEGTLSEWARKLLQKVVFKIFPLQNIAGRKAVEEERKCLRKTLKGVDLNRNWPFAWAKSLPASEEYGGPEPFSEPETRIVNNMLTSQPQAFINLHSGEWAMYHPWDSKATAAENLPADMGELMEKMNTYCQCMKGAAGQVAGYLAMGSSMDYMYAEKHIPYALTFEVYGPSGLGRLASGGHPRQLLDSEDKNQAAVYEKGSIEDCLSQYNPMTREDYESTIANWIGTLLVLADHVVLHPQPQQANDEAFQEQQPEPRSRLFEQDLAVMGEEATQRAHNEVLQKEFRVDMGRKSGEFLQPQLLQAQPVRVASSRAYWIYGSVVGTVFVAALVMWRRDHRTGASRFRASRR